MELRVLRYFLAVAREENITAAAQALHMTQPTLSKQLMELEDELGTKLFERGKRRIVLTEAGEFLRRHAQEIVDLADKTQSAFFSRGEAVLGDVFIGCGETEGMRVLIAAMKRMNAVWPDVRFHLYSGNDEDVAERLDKGLVDFGLFVGRTNFEKYDCLRLPVTDTWGLIVRSDHPLAKKGAVTPEDLRGLPLLCSRQSLERGELSGWLGYDPGALHIVSTHNLVGNAVRMVQEGLGCAIAIDGLIEPQRTDVVFLPFAPRMTAELTLAWKKYQKFSRPAEVFLHFLQEEIRTGNR